MRLALRCLFALVAADGSIVNVIEDFRAAGAPDARIWVDDGGGGAFGRPGAFGSLNLTPQPRGLRADYVVRTDPDFQRASASGLFRESRRRHGRDRNRPWTRLRRG